MKRILPVEELARDERFHRIRIEERVFDPRNAARPERNRNGLKPTDPDSPDGARALMHGIFVGEIQALEGAGRSSTPESAGRVRADAVTCPSSASNRLFILSKLPCHRQAPS